MLEPLKVLRLHEGMIQINSAFLVAGVVEHTIWGSGRRPTER
jgi:hypothetical protein